MAIATLTSKGQMTLPKDVRDDLNLKPGDRIDVIKEGGQYVLRPRNVRIEDLYGILHRPGDQQMSAAEEDEAFAAAVAADDERIRAGR
ncbi:MAG: AbrB/MazE/SpoVT family DNA-binding domain-containing protein [Alphaproteobacteria bacterium]|jgi:antitoxin PrlF|nr:AbrB/MazE/SpoVT family DNA-binding domain-containing protein [Alphaproteobacteria bacterium]